MSNYKTLLRRLLRLNGHVDTSVTAFENRLLDRQKESEPRIGKGQFMLMQINHVRSTWANLFRMFEPEFYHGVSSLEATNMSATPEARYFTAIAQMPALPKETRPSEDAVRDSSQQEDDQSAPQASQSRWQLAWVIARGHWPR